MKPLRKFIIKNYYGFSKSRIPWIKKNVITKEYSLDWMYISTFKGASKTFFTFLIYGIIKIIFQDVEMFIWWWELPMLFSIIMQLSWFTPFYGYSYFDKHPLTDAERMELNNE